MKDRPRFGESVQGELKFGADQCRLPGLVPEWQPPFVPEATFKSRQQVLFGLLQQLKIITRSDDYHLYLVEENKIYRVIISHCKTYPTKWPIKSGNIVASHVAHTKKIFLTSTGIDFKEFRYGVGRKGQPPLHMICLPISSSKSVIGALELNRKDQNSPYTKDEVDIATVICGWASSVMCRVGFLSILEANKSASTSAEILLYRYICDGDTFKQYLSTLLFHVKDRIKGDRLKLSLLCKSKPATVIDYFLERNDPKYFKSNAYRRVLNKTVDKDALFALRTGHVVRIQTKKSDCKDERFFEPEDESEEADDFVDDKSSTGKEKQSLGAEETRKNAEEAHQLVTSSSEVEVQELELDLGSTHRLTRRPVSKLPRVILEMHMRSQDEEPQFKILHIDKDDGQEERAARLETPINEDISYSRLGRSSLARESESVSPQKPNTLLTHLYCPIYSSEDPKGFVLFTTSKQNGFTWSDELVCRDLLSLAAIGFNIHKLRVQNYNRHMTRKLLGLVLYELQPCEHDILFLSKIQLPPKLNKNIFTFSWYPKESGLDLVEYTMQMFYILLGQSFIDNNPNLGYFLIMVKRNYREMPYHNFTHAFITTHSMFNLLLRSREKFYFTELVSLMVAALCHDVDHPGVSNSFLKLTDSYLSRLYEGSVLESHHCVVAANLIKHNKLFSDMSQENYNLVMENIKSYILATDLTYHLKVRADMLGVMSQTGFTWGDPVHRDNLKYLMMTACDLSMSFKNPSDAKEVVLSLYQEFYSQGDMEKEIGVAPLSLMDRSKQDSLPADQTSFLSLVSLPCFDILKEILPNAADLFHQCCNLRDYWMMRSYQPLPRDDLQVPPVSDAKGSSN